MNNIFCTLFDSNYLDKGLVLYDSMCKHMSQFKLYVFACDKKCYEILKVEKSDNLIPIDISELETAYPCLLEAKKDRNTILLVYALTTSKHSQQSIQERQQRYTRMAFQQLKTAITNPYVK